MIKMSKVRSQYLVLWLVTTACQTKSCWSTLYLQEGSVSLLSSVPSITRVQALQDRGINSCQEYRIASAQKKMT